METFTIYTLLTEAQLLEKHEENRQWCIKRIEEYKDHPKKEKIWEILTSRGTQRLMFGECPV